MVDDLNSIFEFESLWFGQHAYPYFVLRQIFDMYAPYWVVADAADSMVGYALVAIGQARSAWLLGLFVTPSYRGGGVGRSLIEHAVARCRAGQVDDVFLTVRPSNAPAASLYRAAGFVHTAYEATYFGVGEPREVLVRHINPESALSRHPGLMVRH